MSPYVPPAGGAGGVDLAITGNSTSAGAGYVTITSGTGILAGGNNITLSQDGQSITISGANAGGAQTGISSIQASDATYTSGKVIFSGVGAATVNSNTGQRVDISVAAQSVQIVQSAIQGSDATYTSGKVILTGVGGGITVSSNTGQRIDLSVAAPVAQTAQTGISSIQASDATYTSGKVIFTGVGGGITVSSNTGQRVDLSVAAPVAQTAQTQSNLQAVVPLGNTAGTTGSIQTGTFGLAGGANITISQSSGTASTNLTIIGGAGAGGGIAAAIGGNSTSAGGGYATITSGTMLLAGGTNITLKQDGQSISVLGPAAGAIEVGGIAASNTTFTSGTVVMSASGGAITINSGAQSVGFSVPQTSSMSAVGGGITISTNGSTISLSVAPPKMHAWQNFPIGEAAPLTALTAISKTPFYWPEYLDGAVTLNSVGFLASVVTTGTLQSFTVHFGVYTYANSTSANLLGSAAESFILSTGTSASFSGQRMWLLTSPGTVAAISNLTPGAYLFGSMISAGATGSMNLSLFGAQNQTGTSAGPLGIVMPGTNNPSTATSQGVLMYGRGSTTVNAMPAAVSRADLVNQGAGASLPIHPYMLIRS